MLATDSTGELDRRARAELLPLPFAITEFDKPACGRETRPIFAHLKGSHRCETASDRNRDVALRARCRAFGLGLKAGRSGRALDSQLHTGGPREKRSARLQTGN